MAGRDPGRTERAPEIGAETDYLAAETVWLEPVSGLDFPANREKYREFSRFQRLRRIRGPITDAFSATYNRIPCGPEQGIF
jgi:hypothetical protein